MRLAHRIGLLWAINGLIIGLNIPSILVIGMIMSFIGAGLFILIDD